MRDQFQPANSDSTVPNVPASAREPQIAESPQMGEAPSVGARSHQEAALSRLAAADTPHREKVKIARTLLGTKDSAEQLALVQCIASNPAGDLAYVAGRSLNNVVNGQAANQLLQFLDSNDLNLRMQACLALIGCPDLQVQRRLLSLVETESTLPVALHGQLAGKLYEQLIEQSAKPSHDLRPVVELLGGTNNLPHWTLGNLGTIPVFLCASRALRGSPHAEIAQGLARLSRSDFNGARFCAIDGLTGSPFPEHSNVLLSLLQDPTTAFRSTIGGYAANALNRSPKTPEVVATLIQWLEDPHRPLRERKLSAIALHGERSAAVALAEIAVNRLNMSKGVRESHQLQLTDLDPVLGDRFPGEAEVRATAGAGVRPDVTEAARLLAHYLTRSRKWFEQRLPELEERHVRTAIATTLQKSDDPIVAELLERGLRRQEALTADMSRLALGIK